MKLDRRITNGLAWAGVAVVIGVPTADWIAGHFAGDNSGAAPQIAVIEPSAPTPAAASTETAAAAKPAATDALDSFVQSGRKLPSYITGGDDTPQAATPAPAATPTRPAVTPPAVANTPAVTQPTAPVTQPVTTPVDVAAVPPAKVAPVPRPLSMRPKTPVAVVQPSQQPLIVQPNQPLIVQPQAPVVVQPPVTVTARDLDDWETGPLSEFLAQRERQQQGQRQPVAPNNGSNGFFLDQIPNDVQPQGTYIGPVTDGFYSPFTQ